MVNGALQNSERVHNIQHCHFIILMMLIWQFILRLLILLFYT